MGSHRVEHDWSNLAAAAGAAAVCIWQPTPVFLPGESQAWQSLVGCRLWGRTESHTMKWRSSSSSSMMVCNSLSDMIWTSSLLSFDKSPFSLLMKLSGREFVTTDFLLEDLSLDKESLWLHLLLFKCPQFKIINNQSDNLSYLEVAYSAIFQWKCLVFWLVTWHIHFSVHFRFYAMLCYAKSLQSCLTLCYPIDGSPPGSPVLGILQARTLEWAAISFSNAWKWKWSCSFVSDS